MVGDLPTTDAKPPPDMIFVCKLNPVTTEEVASPEVTSLASKRQQLMEIVGNCDIFCVGFPICMPNCFSSSLLTGHMELKIAKPGPQQLCCNDLY